MRISTARRARREGADAGRLAASPIRPLGPVQREQFSRPGRLLRAGGVWLVALVALAAILRFATLGVQSFSDDELFTVWLIKMPLGDLLSTVPHSEATPHLYYVLAWICAHLFGTSEVAMRLLPATAGVLTVPVVFATGLLGASRRVGLAAAAFAAVNPFLIWYSQEARAYALLILFVALSMVCLLAYSRTGGGRSALGAWALASAAALATHYFAVFLIAPEVAWLMLAGVGPLRRRVAAVAVPTLTGVALLPLALHQRTTVHDPGGVVSVRGLPERVAAIPKNFLVGFAIPAEAVVVVASGTLAAVALVLALLGSREQERRGFVLAATFAICGIALPVALALVGLDYVSSRNTVAALVPTTIVLGCGFAIGRGGLAALVATCGLSLVTVIGVAADPRYQRPNWRGAARALGPAHTNRLLVFNPPFSNPGPFRVYFGQASWILSPAGAATRVSEVAVVALAEKHGFGPGSPRPPAGPSPPSLPGFHRIEDIRTDTYRLARFTAPRPLTVTPAALASVAFRSVPAVLVWQTAAASGQRP